MAAARQQPLVFATLSDAAKVISRNLYAILQLNVSGKALGVLRLIPKGHGLEAWRQLSLEYAPEIGGRHASLLRSILNSRWWQDHEEKPFMELLNDWEV